MAEDSKIFADSNYFISLFNDSDVLHEKAFEIARRLDSTDQKITISNFIFLEVVTVLSQKRGRKLAVEAGRHLLNGSLINIMHVNEILEQITWRTFQAVSRKNISFVDCSVLACMSAQGINKLLTFDRKDFKVLQKYYRFGFFS